MDFKDLSLFVEIGKIIYLFLRENLMIREVILKVFLI